MSSTKSGGNENNSSNGDGDDGTESQVISDLVCVEYPGLVNSNQRMLETLGGLDNIAQVLDEPNRRLELRFRPDDVFCKPTCERETQILLS